MTTAALTKSLATTRAYAGAAHSRALQLKAAGALNLATSDGMGGFSAFRNDAANRERYMAFRGWLYAAVNALAGEGAGQPACVGRMKGAADKNKRTPGTLKEYQRRKMSKPLARKAAAEEVEVLLDHPLVDVLEQPNPVQGRWQFTYSFIANLCLTGWSYVVGGKTDDGFELYSLPTTWVIPDHTDGPFSKFFIQNPHRPGEPPEEVDPEMVGFAHLPDPADPLSALAPAGSQRHALRIDDHIQTSQSRFFENGIFPAAVVTIGNDPHPDIPAGIKPRLSAAQRRQVVTAIRKVMGGVANYGNPAIVDGLIGGIERLSATQNEMGWEKSEKNVRTRILSAFGVHPFILGEEMAGSFAQAYVVQERFNKRVNTYLAMLGQVVTNFVGRFRDGAGLVAWWEECEAQDPSMHWNNINQARQRDDITQNEVRAMLGLPPDEDEAEATINPSAVGAITGLLDKVGQQIILPEQAAAVLVGMGIPQDTAEEIAGVGREFPEPEPVAPPAVPGAAPAGAGAAAAQAKPKTPEEEADEAVKQLDQAVALLSMGPAGIAGHILEKAG